MTHAQRFRDIYEECYPRVLAYATSLVGRQTGEDITSETFTVAWRRMRDIPQPALPWLLGVARNLVRELRRRDGHQYTLAAEEARLIGSGARAGAGDIAADVTDREAALQALGSLSEADRELLTLIAWHGLAAKQAARVLGCTTATVTVRLHRARRRLEKALEAVVQDTAGEGGKGTAGTRTEVHADAVPLLSAASARRAAPMAAPAAALRSPAPPPASAPAHHHPDNKGAIA